MNKIITKLKYLKRSLGLLQFDNTRDSNYMDRENKTEMLLRVGFDKDKNVHINKFNEIISIHTSIHTFEDVKKFKHDMNNYIQTCIDELQIVEEMNSGKFTGGGKSTKITQKNKQTNIQKVDISKLIDSIIVSIKENESDENKVSEAETNLNELKGELKKENPTWSKMKKSLERLLNFGRDSFIKILPALLDKYTG